MNIQSSISFGKKIPVASCKVKNITTGKFEKAKIFEYDCMDNSDIEEVASLTSGWGFKHIISDGMRTKKVAREKYSLGTGTTFYVLKNAQDKTLGLTYSKSDENGLGIKFIQTIPDKSYKYAGQVLLATHALTALHDNIPKFEIHFPTDDAMGFYTHKCGFKHGENYHHLEMNPEQMKKFIFKTQLRTLSPIVDIRV